VEITLAFVRSGDAIGLRGRLVATDVPTSGARATAAALLVTKVGSVKLPAGSTPQQ
jgi:hypothetical protein